MAHFATGLRFQPSEKQIIAYLLHKVNGKPFPCNDFIFIPTVDLYGENEPWEIIGHDTRNQENYFFTRLKRTNNDGRECISRDIGQGTWQVCGPILCILDKTKQEIGFVQSYKYRSEEISDQDGDWIMKQYTLADKFKCCVKKEYVDYAFCSVRKYRDRYVSGQEIGSLDIEIFFDRILEENSPKENMSDEDVILLSNEFYHGSPSLNLEFCGYKK